MREEREREREIGREAEEKAERRRVKSRIKMASHYHNKQAVRWLVTANCSMSLCLFHTALINTPRRENSTLSV